MDPPRSYGSNPGPGGGLDRRLCQVGGVNQNYVSQTGTLYHIQIEDRGPVMDRVSEVEVRRVNVIVYANYGEANARIVHGRDHDFEDVRAQEHNRFVELRIQDLAAEARQIIEEKERTQIARIKALVREYYLTKDERAKSEFEQANAQYPFLFSRAWRELKAEKAPGAPADTPAPETHVAPVAEVVYPLEANLRDSVIEIERIVAELEQDLQRLKERGRADDILVQTCRKLINRAHESLVGREASDFSTRRLDMTRNSLMTTLKQVKSRLKAS